MINSTCVVLTFGNKDFSLHFGYFPRHAASASINLTMVSWVLSKTLFCNLPFLHFCVVEYKFQLLQVSLDLSTWSV